MEDFNFRKMFFILGCICGLMILVHRAYSPEKVLDFTTRHPDYYWSPRIQYYVGLGAYLRDENTDAVRAFQQILTEYPTCYYAPFATYRLGGLYSEQMHWADARDMYLKYMETWPEGDKIEIVRKKYEYIKFR